MSHTEHHDTPNEKKSKTAFSSSFWFVLILVGLFVAAVNFVEVMGHSEGHATIPTREATSNGTLSGETGIGKTKEDTTQYHGPVTAHDSATREGQH